jgi:DNA mismatch repair protein MSH5
MTQEGLLLIDFSRHPLQELTVASYIPNDINLCGGCGARQLGTVIHSAILRHSNAPNMLLLTGPNFSGKSVYMKQVSFHNRLEETPLTTRRLP